MLRKVLLLNGVMNKKIFDAKFFDRIKIILAYESLKKL